MSQAPPPPPVCPRHPDRISYLRCQRCERPACPECQRPAPVGFHCRDCLAAAGSSVGGGVVRGSGDKPMVTYVIIGLCALAFVMQLTVPGFTRDLQFAPLLGRDEPWRMLTAAFLHDSGQLMHIMFNMLALWQVGQWLEPSLGRARFLALYLITALGGSVAYLLLASPPQSIVETYTSSWLIPTVGASGAVFGLFGALLVFLRHLGRPARGLIVLLAINGFLPVVFPNIAWQVHLGGFITGLVLATVMVQLRQRPALSVQWPAIALVAAVIVGLAMWRYATVDDAYVRSLLRI